MKSDDGIDSIDRSDLREERERRQHVMHGWIWLAVYLALALAPLGLLLVGPTPPGSGFWFDFSLALGFAGTAMIGVQFILTARFKRATAPFGIDIIYFFHRYAAVVGFILVLAHPVILVVDNPGFAYLLDPREAPWHMVAGLLSLLAMLVIVVTSLARKQLHIDYDRWRLGHGLLAVAALVLALVHIEGVGYYVSEPWHRGLWILIVVSWIAVLVFIRIVRPLLLLRRPYRVVAVERERGDSWTLALEPKGHAGFRFQPGQFVWLTLRHSPFALREHPFSISSSPTSAPHIEVTIKELGDFTGTIGSVTVGETAYVDGPYGAFSIDRHATAPGYVFLAGGIGIAPMMSMLRTLAARGDRRPLVLVSAHSRWDRIVFREEIHSLAERLRLTVVHTLEAPPEDWQGERGYVNAAMLDRHLPANRAELDYFICGPKPMIDAAEKALASLGVPLSRFHTELFDLA